MATSMKSVAPNKESDKNKFDTPKPSPDLEDGSSGSLNVNTAEVKAQKGDHKLVTSLMKPFNAITQRMVKHTVKRSPSKEPKHKGGSPSRHDAEINMIKTNTTCNFASTNTCLNVEHW